MIVTVPEDDRLVAVSVPESVAGSTMLHATTGGGAGGGGHVHHGGGDTSGTVTMTEMGAVSLEAAKPYAFEPGGSHVMLVDLRAPLVAGTRFPMTLDFEHAGTRTVSVRVLDNPPG